MSATRRVRAVATSVVGFAVGALMAVVVPAADAAAMTGQTCLLPDADFEPAELGMANHDSDALAPYVAARIGSVGCAWSHDVRAIVLDRHEVRLQVGGRLARRFPLDPPEAGAMTLDGLAAIIDDPEWISLQEGGVVTVAAAIVQEPGTALTVGGSAVSEVRLLDRRYVGIVGLGATASFDDVTVVSWSAAADGPVRGHNRLRPFVLYDHGSRLDLSNAVFAWLGSRASGATGVTWADRSGGTVASTAFSNNYIGATATEPDAGEALIFMYSAFLNSVTDGVRVVLGDGPTLETNTMQGNGGDGVAVHGATGAVVRDNHVWGNDRHGIVIGSESVEITVADNVIEPNGVDGVVLDGVVDSRVVGNVIGAHRSGIRLVGGETARNTVSLNVLSSSPIGVQLAGGAIDNRVERNEISGATVARIHTEESVASAAASAEIGSVRGRTLGVDRRQDRNGLWLVGAVFVLCGAGGEWVRRRRAPAGSADAVVAPDHGSHPTGKAAYVRTSDH